MFYNTHSACLQIDLGMQYSVLDDTRAVWFAKHILTINSFSKSTFSLVVRHRDVLWFILELFNYWESHNFIAVNRWLDKVISVKSGIYIVQVNLIKFNKLSSPSLIQWFILFQLNFHSIWQSKSNWFSSFLMINFD